MSAENASEKKGLWSQIWVYAMIAVAVLMVIFYVLRPVGEELAVTLTQIFIIVFVAAAGVVFLLVSNQFNWFNTKTGQIMFLIAIGFILWTIAESIYFYFASIGVELFPTVADIFYVAGYVPFAIGLILNIRTIKMKFKPLMLWMWIGLSAAVFVVILVTEFIPFLLPEPTIDSLTLIYPAEDLMLFVLALVLVLKFRSGEIAKPWILLVAGVIMDALGDIWYTYAEWYGLTLSAYDLYDLFFTLSYIAMLAAGLYFLWLYKKH